MTAIHQNIMSVEDYIQYELTSELRHEYINGQLIEMPGEKALNNRKAGLIYQFLTQFLLGYEIYWNDVKVAITGENRFYYPDLFATKEIETKQNEYVKYQPELIVEVISKTSRIRDTVDKYLNYIKIPSLKYYLVIDPETPYVIVHSKNEAGEWEADAYSSKEDVIALPLLEIELPMNVVYR
jgi:Uma2 family endonuclease